MKAPYRKDARPAEFFSRFHKRSRKRSPWLQGVAVIALLPLLSLLARVRIRGREHIPHGAFLAAANHPSQLDPFFVAIALRRRMSFMGKSDLFVAGWRGRMFARLGAFPVRRGVWDTDAFDTALHLLGHGRPVVMFPEGGVSAPDGSYRDPRPGIGYVACLAGVPVLPVHLHGTRKLYKPWSWPRVTVTVGEPITVAPIDEPQREDSERVAVQIMTAIIALGAAADG